MGVIFRNGISYGGGGSELYFSSKEDFPEEGTAEDLYIAEDENKIYRWNSEDYIMIGGDTPTIEAREDGVLVGDGNLWVKESPYKITQTNDGDFIVVDDNDNKKNYYLSGLRNIYLSPFTSSSEKITGDRNQTIDFNLEAYSFGSELKKVTIKDSLNNNKEIYTQDTCFKMLSTSKMFLTGNTEIVVGNQKILPYAYHSPKTELKFWDGAKILVEGISSISSEIPIAPSGNTISRPDIHIAGSVKMTIDQGQICANTLHYAYGGEAERWSWSENTRRTQFGPEFIIHDSPTFDISGSPYFYMHGTGMFNLDTEGTCIVRDKGLVQVENNGRIYLGTNGAKGDKANPHFVMTGCGMIKAQTESVDEGPLFLMEETGFIFNGKGYQAGSKEISNQILDQTSIIEALSLRKEMLEISNLVSSITTSSPLNENNADDLIKINKIREFFTKVDNAQDWSSKRDKFYPGYTLSVCSPLKQSEYESMVSLLYRIRNNYGLDVLSYLSDGALTLYVNKKDQLFPTSISDYWDSSGRLKVSTFLGRYQDGDAIVKIYDVNVILTLISNMKSSSLKFLEFQYTDGARYVDQIIGNDELANYNDSSKKDTADYISAFPTGNNLFPSPDNLSTRLIDIRVSDQVSWPQTILNNHNQYSPNSSFDHFFFNTNGFYLLRGKNAGYPGPAANYSESVLKLQSNDFIPKISPQIRYYGESRLDIGGYGGTYLRMGSREDGVIEGYLLDNCKFELRDDTILDLRGAQEDHDEDYFVRANGPVIHAYGQPIFLLDGLEEEQTYPAEYRENVAENPFFAMLNNSHFIMRKKSSTKFYVELETDPIPSSMDTVEEKIEWFEESNYYNDFLINVETLNQEFEKIYNIEFDATRPGLCISYFYSPVTRGEVQNMDSPVFEAVGKSELRLYDGAVLKVEVDNGDTKVTFGNGIDQEITFAFSELEALKRLITT